MGDRHVIERSLASTANADPGPFLDEVREAGGIVWDEQMNAWIITAHDLVREVSRRDNVDWRTPLIAEGESESNAPLGQGWERWTEFSGSRYRVFSTDGALHKRLHRWWFQTLLASARKGVWRSEIVEPLAHRAIDRFADQGEAELGQAYGDWAAPRIILNVLGIDDFDDEMVAKLFSGAKRQDEALEHLAGVAPPDVMAAAIEGRKEMNEIFLPYIEERRSGEGDDFISMIWRGSDELFGGEEFDERDIASQCVQAFMAGSDTAGGVVANGVYLLLTNRDLQDHVRTGGPEAAQTFVEEVLRLYGPVTFTPRYARTDVVLGGVQIKEGELLIAHSGAAGRDPDHYEHPAEVDLGMNDAFDHFAFFRGPRQCPGRPFARMELEVLFSTLVERLDDLRLDPEKEQPRYLDLMIRQWRPLHALFTQR
jgi:cytochrome P450